jgi:alpha-tubulin suppressor-like RCC1 family protein
MKPRNLALTVILLGTSARLALGQVAAPVLNPAEGDSFAQFPLTITCSTPGAQIRYTLNGEEPTLYDPSISSGGTVTINRNWTVKAKAWSGVDSSSTTTGVFTLTGDIAGGGAHSLGLRTPGALWAWGLQTGGRLGNNASAAANISTPVASRYTSGTISDARMIAAGTDHSTFLKNGGTVWSFGTNSTGQLGDNSTTSRMTAVQVKKSTGASDWLTGSVAVAAGQGFSLSLASNGEVFAWGDKTSERLGDGTTTGTRLFAGKVVQPMHL